ncbi:MAG: hypothetical protein IJ759_07880 [Bacteroidales bacterium]|nr:hypothetical protein [Bacteroidales bacterium]MBR1775423.1 hypothetical protein [Bacteroidales bacterium]
MAGVTKESRQNMFGKCVKALTNLIAEDEIKCNDKDFTLSVNITGKSYKIVSSIIKAINNCQRYYKVDELNSVITNDVTSFDNALVLSFYSPVYDRMFGKK